MRRLLPVALAMLPLATAVAQQTAPPSSGAGTTPSTAQGQSVAPSIAVTWVAKPLADLIALDKVAARPTPLSVKVGQPAVFRSLTITVRACLVRPPDQPPDAAAFLDISDGSGAVPEFHGWMLLSEPALSMLQHPVYDVRLAGCRG